jgi:dipeptidyl-peptidase-4
MRSLFWVLIVLSLTSCASAPHSNASPGDSRELTVARIFEDPSLEGTSPRALKFSPDGARVTYLKGKKENFRQLDLWEFNLSTREHRMLADSALFMKGTPENLSAEEKAQRERKRISDSGIIEYSFSRDGSSLVFPVGGALYYYPLSTRKPLKLTSGRDHETDAHLSPRGRYVSFVRGPDLYVTDTRTLQETRLTRDGSRTVKNGLAEFIAQEEMDRFDGQWWSRDERHLAFTRTDESGVEIAKRYEIGANGVDVTEQRYPRTGTPNVRVRLGVISPQGGAPRWLNLGANADIYLARVDWLPDNRHVAAQIESRDQKRLDLVVFDALTGERRVVLTEQDPKWLELSDDLRFLQKSPRFVWSSQRTGMRQLYLYDLSGKLIRPLTSQPLPVTELTVIDPDEKWLYFVAPGDTPLEQHLFRTALDAPGPLAAPATRLTQAPGYHVVTMPRDARSFIDTYSNERQPPQVSVNDAESGKLIAYLEENRLDANHPLTPYLERFSKPRYGSFTSDEGVELYYRLIPPRDYREGQRYPLLVYGYGGPGRSLVHHKWGGKQELWLQTMAARGFAVLTVDNRGTPGRDRAFETAIYHRMGDVEVRDQAAGVKQMIREGLADPERVGIFGWSYGGYLTLMSMMKRPDVFKAGASVAPVSDWTLYDTHYTERFLGTPKVDPEGYEASSVLKYVPAPGQSMGKPPFGKLFMAHGMADDNVLFTNSTRVYKALQDRMLPFEMMVYPGGKHGLYGKSSQTHVFERITDFFVRTLKPESP